MFFDENKQTLISICTIKIINKNKWIQQIPLTNLYEWWYYNIWNFLLSKNYLNINIYIYINWNKNNCSFTIYDMYIYLLWYLYILSLYCNKPTHVSTLINHCSNLLCYISVCSPLSIVVLCRRLRLFSNLFLIHYSLILLMWWCVCLLLSISFSLF